MESESGSFSVGLAENKTHFSPAKERNFERDGLEARGKALI